jgi:WS/DGAT/MGAT family acyltransferase
MSSSRLSALDAGFLYAERSEFPMHVGGVATFEGSPLFDDHGRFRLDEIRTALEARLPLVPRLHQRPVWPPVVWGRPVWVDDPHFDICRHVTVFDAPGIQEHQLFDMVARTHSQLLERSRPLWHLMFVTGLEGDRVALIERIHHAMVDGLAGVDVAALLLDTERDAPRPESIVASSFRTTPRWSLAVPSIVEQAVRPWRAARAAASSVRRPQATVGAALRLAWAVGAEVRGLPAPRCSLNLSAGEGRRYDVVRHSLESARAARAHLGGSVNDVVLAATTTGLRHLLEGRGELRQVADVTAFVPVSRRDGPAGTLGNQVAGIFVPLPVAEPDPVARYEQIRATTAKLKARHSADALAGLSAIAEWLPEPVVFVTARAVHRQPFINLVVTNVPGPSQPLYALGARMLEVFPVVPLARNLTVSVGVMSYAGQLNIGLLGDRTWMSDLGVLAAGIEEGYAELAAAAHGVRMPTPEIA